MKDNEKFWKIAEIVFGALGAALLVLILVLKLLGKDVTPLTYPIVAIVILFLVCDEIKRAICRRREKEEKTQEQTKPSDEPETVLPKDAFKFDSEAEESKQ